MRRVTVGETVARCAHALTRARVHFGHGTANARDEAAELVFFAARLDHSLGEAAYARALEPAAQRRIDGLLRARIESRKPLAYLTHRAFFASFALYVDERVLVPRSPIAELIQTRFSPWIAARDVRRIADVGTGSGALAIAAARAFPRAQVDALDLSADALEVCERNIRRFRLGQRVRALRSNHLDAMRDARYDVIVSNPPYVTPAELRSMPREYRHEPRIGLAAGADGLASIRALLRAAHRHLTPRGLLVVEVGNRERQVEVKWPRLPFIWPHLEAGGGVFLLHAADVPRVSRVSGSRIARP